MVFNVTLGFNQLENPSADSDRSRVYALLIGDTVLVNKVSTILLLCSALLPFCTGWSGYRANNEI